MKTLNDFYKDFEKVKVPKEFIQSKYDDYCKIKFNEWLSKMSADEVNKVGIDTLWEVWNTLDYEDR